MGIRTKCSARGIPWIPCVQHPGTEWPEQTTTLHMYPWHSESVVRDTARRTRHICLTSRARTLHADRASPCISVPRNLKPRPGAAAPAAPWLQHARAPAHRAPAAPCPPVHRLAQWLRCSPRTAWSVRETRRNKVARAQPCLPARSLTLHWAVFTGQGPAHVTRRHVPGPICATGDSP